MKQFLKFTLASMVGFGLVIVILVWILLGLVSSLSEEKEVQVSSASVLHITLDDPIYDRASGNPLDRIGLSGFPKGQALGLTEITELIRDAALDDRIKGIYLDISYLQAGLATVEELRNALINFKGSKKFIVSYSEVYTQKAYYLASMANEVYLSPSGVVEFKGLTAHTNFYQHALEKLGVEVQVIRHGQYKSAVEPFVQDSMSPANREQNYVLIHSIWDHLVGDMSLSRDISIAHLNAVADSLLVRRPSDALKHRLVDDVIYEDEVHEILRGKCGLEEDQQVSFLTLRKYKDARRRTVVPRPKDKIAVIYAEGTIQGGKEDGPEYMGSDAMTHAIRTAREDASVKAIVLRVNSPGGSAIASDAIWREMVLARLQKPVVVSMGDVAASGGYYIACAADTIVAGPGTITGSIGVFGLLPNFRELLQDKLGIDFDTVKTHRFSDFGNLERPLFAEERNAIQDMVEHIYDDFLEKVSRGRDMEKALVDSIGQGRVWSGASARKIGLVDVLGDMETAMEIAARMAKLETYRVIHLPQRKEFLQQIMEDLSGDMTRSRLRDELGSMARHYHTLKMLQAAKGVQALMPYDLIVE